MESKATVAPRIPPRAALDCDPVVLQPARASAANVAKRQILTEARMALRACPHRMTIPVAAYDF
jgi:hypothetical protein